MTGNKYIIRSQKFDGLIRFSYDLKGYLKSFEIDGENITSQQHKWILCAMVEVAHESMAQGYFLAKKIKIELEPMDLSFDFFWKSYDYKKGKKVQTQNTWKKLSKEDKIKALLAINKLKQDKMMDGTALPYPSSYLNQRYFDN